MLLSSVIPAPQDTLKKFVNIFIRKAQTEYFFSIQWKF